MCETGYILDLGAQDVPDVLEKRFDQHIDLVWFWLLSIFLHKIHLIIENKSISREVLVTDQTNQNIFRRF